MKRAKAARFARAERLPSGAVPQPAMQQLVLDIRPLPQPTFDGFVAGANAELVSRLRCLAAPSAFDAIYLWGPAGSGRSHLLRATAAAAHARGRSVSFADAEEIGAELALPPGGLLIVDNVERLGPTAQITLFRAFNTARLIGLALLVAGHAPPASLDLREDLRTRVGGMLIYEVKPLTDEEKAETLARHAASRGMRVEHGIIDYLLRHGERDLPSLMAVLDALDRVSLEQQRPVTLPLLREALGSIPGLASGAAG